MPAVRRKKKKVDHEALNSAFMRIPRMNVETARLLLDQGIRELYELQGRSPEAILDEHCSMKKSKDKGVHIQYLRMAVYFAETEDPSPAKLHPNAWNETL